MAHISDSSPKPWSHQWLLYLGLISLGIFAWLPNSYVAMRDWFWLPVWQGGFLCVGLWFLLTLRDYHRSWQTLGYGLDWGIGALALSLLLSTLGAASPKAAAWYLVMVLGHGLALYALRNWLQQNQLWQRLWVGLCIVGTGSAVVSLGLWLPQADWFSLRNGLPLGSYGAMGGYLVLILPMVVALAIARKGQQRLFWGVGAGLILLDLYTTAARSALVAIAIVGVFSYILSLANLRRDFSFQKLTVRSLLLAVVLLTAGLNPRVFASANWQNIQPTVASDLNLVGSVKSRFLLWVTSTDFVQLNPLNGIGIGNLGRSLDLFRPLTGQSPETPHLFSTPLQILSEMGLYGVVAALLLLFMVMRLWLSMLPYVEQGSAAELLIYGIGAGWASYGMVCFVDYQLEYLPISLTLVATLALLLAIAQIYSPEEQEPFSNRQRRGIQLVGLWFLTVVLYLGLPMTFAVALNDQAQEAKGVRNTDRYEEKLQEAHRLVPWQQSHMVDLGMHYWQQRQEKLATGLAPGEFEILSGSIRTYFQAASRAVPDDVLLKYNDGAIAVDFEPERSTQIFEDLLKNDANRFPYVFYFLAQSYSEQELYPEKVEELLALQLLRTPEFLTAPRWDTEPTLKALRDKIYPKAIAHYEALLKQLPPNSRDFQQLYETMLLLKWWQNDFLGQVTPSRLRPAVQAIILADSQPQRSLEIINDALAEIADDLPTQLLKAWFDPEFAISIERPNGETVIVSQPSESYANLREWIADIFPSELVTATPVPNRDFRYRDPNLAGLSRIIPPANLRSVPMLDLLGLFGDRPVPEVETFLTEQQQTLLE
ncbi:O-antigen ligase [[Leptolyngbya] sp. PCC 7376]|uniref:O-antigen ligase family protein n=1 Tax=[Leptolyngbya] sp. PCC 7376 TaxID=111781 RepID=UPI0005A18615|nr:O-antigen ligase family protein [[Leptolyngbya] sp. PCC 7376]